MGGERRGMDFQRIKKATLKFYRSRFFAPLTIIVFVLLANGLYLSGLFNSNPLNVRSGLVNSITLGPLNGQFTIDPSDGYYAQALGRRVAIDVLKGHIPWWNHYEGIGAPLIGGLQSAALFPMQFLLVFPNGLLYFHITIEILAGLGTYYFLRRIGVHDKAALFGALAFAVHGTFSWIAHTIVNPIAFLPWLLLGVEMMLNSAREGRRRGWLVFALAVMFTAYAGFPETGFINGIFAGIWALVRLGTLPKKAYKAYFAKLAAGLAVGIALSAPLLVAFAGYLPYANLGVHAQSTSEMVLPKMGIVGLIMPYVYGPIFASYNLDDTGTLYAWWATVGGYLSLPVLVLAALGLIKAKFRRADKVYLVAWTIFCLFATFGILWMNYVAGNIPVVGLAAFARYFPPTYAFATIMLAAMGLTYLLQTRERDGMVAKLRSKVRKAAGKGIEYVPLPTRRFVLLLGGISMIVTVLIWWLLGREQYHNLSRASHIFGWYHGSLIWALVTIIALTGLLLMRKHRRIMVAGLMAVVLCDAVLMFIIPMFSAPRKATINTQPVIFLKQNLGTYRFFSLGPVAPNYGSYYGVASVNINDIPQPQAYSDYITEKLFGNVSPIIFTGTNVSDPKGQMPKDGFLENVKNYEEIGTKYIAVPPGTFNAEEIERASLKQVYADADGTAQIFELANPKPYFEAIGGNCKLEYSGRETVTADCSQASRILRREQFMPGWTARIEGPQKRDVAVTRYENIFQVVSLPKGKSTISYDYTPPYVRPMYWVLAMGVLAVVYTYIIPAAWRKRMDSRLSSGWKVLTRKK